MNQNARNWEHCLAQAALSDVGLRRSNNQDSKAVVLASAPEKWRERGHVFMVADGMGAHAAGELASKLATDTIPLTYQKLRELAPPDALREAVEDANRLIHTRGQANADFRGMGTTASVLALLPQGALVAHVGDSRAYRVRRNRLEQLTFDHSLVWEIRAAENLSAGQVPDYIPKNVITRSLGPNPTVRVDLEGPFPVEIGDKFLLCSDGLSGQVSDEEIGKILACLPPEEAVASLVDLANLRGGPDNITVVVAEVTGRELTRAGAEESERGEAGVSKNLAIWGLFALFAVAGLGLAAAAATIDAFWLGMAAAACGIGAVVTGVSAAIQPGREPKANRDFDSRPLGKGPYVACDCTANVEFVGQLAGTVDQLRQVAQQEHWLIDPGPVAEFVDMAAAATDQGDYPLAIRNHCRAIHYLMGQLKARRGGK